MNNEYELLEKKLHNVQRTKLRLKNNLNERIEELELKLNESEKEKNELIEKLKTYEKKLEEVKWATEWDNLELEPEN